MRNVFFISEKTLKGESFINDNVDPMYISPAIKTAQEIGLEPIIGTKLYNKLCDLIEGGQVEGEYKTLLDEYIKPYLIYKVMAEIQVPLTYKQRNSGITKTNNENEVNTELKDANYMADYYDKKANFYAIRMSDFLNYSNIPEYTCGNGSELDPKPGAYNTGIYLGSAYKKTYIGK